MHSHAGQHQKGGLNLGMSVPSPGREREADVLGEREKIRDGKQLRPSTKSAASVAILCRPPGNCYRRLSGEKTWNLREEGSFFPKLGIRARPLVKGYASGEGVMSCLRGGGKVLNKGG